MTRREPSRHARRGPAKAPADGPGDGTGDGHTAASGPPEPSGDGQVDWQQALAGLVYTLRDVAVAACDTDLQLTAYSPAFRDLIGGEVPRNISSVERDLVAVDESGRQLGVAEWPLARALHGEVVQDAMLRLFRGDGTDLYVRCNSAPCRDADGGVVGAILLVEDVTEEYLRQRHDTELRERLIETINHEFRTPLSAVLGHAELLEDMRLDLPPAAQQFLAAIVDGARRLHALTEAVSELVDLYAAQDLTVRAGDLCGCVRHEIDAVRRFAAVRQVQVEGTMPARLAVRADLGLVGRSVAALLRTAVEHAPASSAVTVTVKDDGARRLHALTEAVSELVDLYAAQDLTVRAGDLCACVRHEIDAVRRFAAVREVQVESTMPARLAVRADLGLVGRSVAALLRTAVEHAPASSAVTVTVKDDGARAVVEIADTGPAPAAWQVDHGERSFPVEGRDLTSPTSEGLGLALARTVAGAHGGTVRVERNRPTGVRVALVLPLAPPRADAPTAARGRARRRAGHKSRRGARS